MSKAIPESLVSDAAERQEFEAFQRTDRELREAERALRQLEEEKRELLEGDDDGLDPDVRLAALDGLEDQIAAGRLAVNKAANAYCIRGDRMHRLRVEGRGRQQTELQAEVHTIEGREQEINREIIALQHQAQELLKSLEPLELQRRALLGRIERLEPRPAVHLALTLVEADPLRPPTDVLIRPSAWRLLVEKAKAHGLPSVQIAVDEFEGRITKAPFPL